ncbi:MAG TPA: hypothetical protein VHP58_00160 [Alphaproteobacteria bacterium]|nr:hypothetical protein [Alphaproteobacteria bacterium]
MVLTLVDWIIIAAGLAASLNAVQRGLGKELLHTFLLLIGIVAGALLLKDTSTPVGADAAAPAVATQFVNFGFYLLMLYVLLWVGIRTFGILIIGDYYGGWRSKFWGGILALIKVISLGLGFMLAYAVASPLPSPDRVLLLPKMLSASALVNFADVQADIAYHALARAGWLNDTKLPSTVEPQPVSPTIPAAQEAVKAVQNLPDEVLPPSSSMVPMNAETPPPPMAPANR